MTVSKWTSLMAVAAALTLSACAAEEGGEMEEAVEEAAPAPAAEEGAMMEPVSVAMEPKNESGVTGEATATHHGDSVTVEVSIAGASAEGEFMAHVHSGTCAETGGVLAALTSLQVSGGSGTSATTLAASEVPQDQGAVIQVHDTTGTPVACGDLMGHGDMEGMEGETGGASEEDPAGT
jgi:hypothetical protein